MRSAFVERFLGADVPFEDAAQYRRVLLINAILSFAVLIFVFFGFYNLATDRHTIATMDFVAAVAVLLALVDLRLNKKVDRAGEAGIWSLFFFFISFAYVNGGSDFGLIWTIFFPIFVFLMRGRGGIVHVLIFYAVLFTLAYANIGIWQEGRWSSTGFVRLVAASVLLAYVAYVSERARNRAEAKNDELLAREKAYSAQLRAYQAELEERVSQTLSDLSDREKIILRNAQMAEMGSLIGVIAHQLKQPLAVLNLLDDELKELYGRKALDDAYIRRHSQDFERQIDHMVRTVDDFRNFFNPNKQKKRFILAESVRKTLELMGSSLQRDGIIVEPELDESIALNGFESELQQALINLLNNAKDALLEHKTARPRIRIVAFLDLSTRSPILRIEDNAGGIPEAILNRVFDFYFTTKDEAGTGIGLYLVKKIMTESFGGEARAENTDTGARFTLIFAPLDTTGGARV